MNMHQTLERIRHKEPLVQCITNVVTINDCANLLLACGARPTMAQYPWEVEEAVGYADALVCNLGAIENLEAMIRAGRRANALGIPVVFDPVGAGSTSLRRQGVATFLDAVHVHAIRGNASEIRALAGKESSGKGVDVGRADAITAASYEEALALARDLALHLGTVIAVSGEVDLVCDGRRSALLTCGCATMARITGSGCMLTTLLGACCAVEKDPFLATTAGMGLMGTCGEIAERKRLSHRTGNATFRNDLIDAFYNLEEEDLKGGAGYVLVEG